MPPQKKQIPLDDVYITGTNYVKIKGLKTLLRDELSFEKIAEYYGVSTKTIQRRRREMEKDK